MRLLAIDPGNEESALLIYDTESRLPVEWEKVDNVTALTMIEMSSRSENLLAIEMVASYGMAVGATVFDTCVWAGRFIERWRMGQAKFARPEHMCIYRKNVKLHLCGSTRAKDPNVRQALIDRYGPGKDKAIGKKATPGPLYGMSGDCWAALAVAVTVAEGNEL